MATTTTDRDPKVTSIIKCVDQVLGGIDRPVPLHVPTIDGNAATYVQECIDTGWVSSVGSFVNRFEHDLAAYTGAKHAVAVVNGTTALHTALLVAGIQRNDEVLMPALTFVATANAVSYCGAVPHFIDTESVKLGIDPQRIGAYLEGLTQTRGGQLVNQRTGRRIAAVIGVHIFGHPFDLDGILELCERFNLPLIEDAAESLGSFYRNRHTGTFGQVGILSFNGNKTITTGGGGALLTDDPAIAKAAKHLTTTAKTPHRWAYNHDQIAYNYRLPNLNAALGCAQLERLPALLDAKRRLAARYIEAFSNCDAASIFVEPTNCRSNYWLNTIILDRSLADRRDDALEALHEAGYLVRPIWTPMHQLPIYQSCPRMDLTITESLSDRVINLPSSAELVTM